MNCLNFIKKIVKKTKYGSYLVAFLPKRLIYTKTYREIVELYRLARKGKDEDIDDILRNRMVSVLRNALTNVPYYRNNINISPDSINTINVYEKLSLFPYLDKSTVMENWEDFVNDKYSISHLKIGSTEGTTGQGMKIASNLREIGAHAAFIDSILYDFKYDKIKDKTVRIGLEALRGIDEYPCAIYGNRLLISPVHLVPRWFDVIYNEIKTYKPKAIHSYPTLLFLLSQYIIENNLNPLKIDLLLLASDVFLYTHKVSFDKAFENPDIVCIYNMSEHVALGVATVDDKNKRISYKLEKMYAYNENRIDDFGKSEIVGTSYWNEVMPLIRYKTKDYGIIDKSNQIGLLEGRGQNYLTTKNGDKVAGISILEPEDYFWDIMSAYQFVQKEPGKIIMRLIPKDKFTSSSQDKIIHDLEKRWPNLFDFSIEIVSELQKGNSTKVQSIIVEM